MSYKILSTAEGEYKEKRKWKGQERMRRRGPVILVLYEQWNSTSEIYFLKQYN